MKPIELKTVVYSSVFAVLLISAGCTTIDMSTYEDEHIYAELETNNAKQVTLTVENRSGDEFTLEQTGAAYRYNNRESPLVAAGSAGSGGTASQMLLPPGAQRSWNFVAQHAINLSGGKQSIGNWVPEDSSALEFRFMYHLDGEERSLTFPNTDSRHLVGKLQVTVDIGLPFLKSIADRRRKAYDQAVAQARASFGAGGKALVLVNLRYDSKTNGFVENVTLSADVVEAGN
jgi:hypothetical protein